MTLMHTKARRAHRRGATSHGNPWLAPGSIIAIIILAVAFLAALVPGLFTSADPYAGTDVALLAVYQRASNAGVPNIVSDVTDAPGWPTEAELLQRYAALSGRDLGHLGFHVGLAAFKLAVILEGIHYRYVHGQTVGAGFDQIGQLVDPLVMIGLDALKERA